MIRPFITRQSTTARISRTGHITIKIASGLAF